jgi:hypothetical protein
LERAYPELRHTIIVRDDHLPANLPQATGLLHWRRPVTPSTGLR